MTALRESEEMEPGDLRRAISAQKLAIVYQMRGEYATAELLYKQAITGWQKTPATIDAEIGLANALTNLATLYHAERKLVEAEPLLDRALALIGGRRGSDSPDVAAVLHNLATVYALTNRDAAAESMYQRELDIYKRRPGDDLRMTAALNGIAVLRVRQTRYPEAEKLFWQVLALRERNLGPSHPDLIKPLSNLGDLQRLQQHNEKAEALFRRGSRLRNLLWGRPIRTSQ